MDKIIMLSIIAVVVAFPAMGARLQSPRRGLVISLALVAIGLVLYIFTLIFVGINQIDTTIPPQLYRWLPK